MRGFAQKEDFSVVSRPLYHCADKQGGTASNENIVPDSFIWLSGIFFVKTEPCKIREN